MSLIIVWELLSGGQLVGEAIVHGDIVLIPIHPLIHASIHCMISVKYVIVWAKFKIGPTCSS